MLATSKPPNDSFAVWSRPATLLSSGTLRHNSACAHVGEQQPCRKKGWIGEKAWYATSASEHTTSPSGDLASRANGRRFFAPAGAPEGEVVCSLRGLYNKAMI